MEQAQWYFDLVSPFAYLHYHQLDRLRDRIAIHPVPVLFAGLLKHWETKGPAEVPPKRLHTYQYCVWAAQAAGVAFRMPPRHPFNPLAAQRLLAALGPTDAAVQAAFQFVYGEGRDPEQEFGAFADRLGVPDGAGWLASAGVKQRLIANTEQAIGQGVFGVPSLVLRGHVFWGSDTVDWAADFIDNPTLFEQDAYAAAAAVEFGVARR